MPDKVIPIQPHPETRLEIRHVSRVLFRVGNQHGVLHIPIPVLELNPEPAKVVPIRPKLRWRENEDKGSVSLLNAGLRASSIGDHKRESVSRRFGLLSKAARAMNVLTTKDVVRSVEMNRFTIDAGNKVSDEAETSGLAGSKQFSSLEEFVEMTRDWPLTRLVAVWNGRPSVKAVKRFTDRKTAVTRIWKTLIAGGEANDSTRSTKRVGNRRKKAPSLTGSKTARILTLLRQPKGASLHEIMDATGWQAHSVRGFISGQLGKKMGLHVRSFQSNQERVYAIRT